MAEDDDLTLIGERGPETSAVIHIRIQQRNGRKSLTTVQGLNAQLDVKMILKALKQDFNCNGCVVESEELGKVLHLSGDQRSKVFQFLTKEALATPDQVRIHGA